MPTRVPGGIVHVFAFEASVNSVALPGEIRWRREETPYLNRKACWTTAFKYGSFSRIGNEAAMLGSGIASLSSAFSFARILGDMGR